MIELFQDTSKIKNLKKKKNFKKKKKKRFFESEKGKESLRNVLNAFALFTPEIGYCQGMNFIAGVLILFMKDEEKAFWSLVKIIHNILPKDYYSANMVGSRVDQIVIESILVNKFPEISKKFKQSGVELAVVTTGWLVCLFFNSFPTEVKKKKF